MFRVLPFRLGPLPDRPVGLVYGSNVVCVSEIDITVTYRCCQSRTDEEIVELRNKHDMVLLE